MRSLVALLLLTACHHDPAPAAQPAGAPAAADPSSSKPASAAAPVSAELLAAVCAGPCAGPFARVTVFRDAGGAVGRVRLDGDIQRCSSPPTTYFDAQGRQTEGIGLRPIVPGSAEETEIRARQARQLEGLTEAEHLSCKE
jgi:hypothetical protein